jgi:hypothetical protein
LLVKRLMKWPLGYLKRNNRTKRRGRQVVFFFYAFGSNYLLLWLRRNVWCAPQEITRRAYNKMLGWDFSALLFANHRTRKGPIGRETNITGITNIGKAYKAKVAH